MFPELYIVTAWVESRGLSSLGSSMLLVILASCSTIILGSQSQSYIQRAADSPSSNAHTTKIGSFWAKQDVETVDVQMTDFTSRCWHHLRSLCEGLCLRSNGLDEVHN